MKTALLVFPGGTKDTTDLPGCLMSRWDVMFSEFWKECPRKISKMAARRAWRKLCPKKHAELDNKFAAITCLLRHRTRNDWHGREKRALPYPSTFLHDESFDYADVKEALAE